MKRWRERQAREDAARRQRAVVELSAEVVRLASEAQRARADALSEAVAALRLRAAVHQASGRGPEAAALREAAEAVRALGA